MRFMQTGGARVGRGFWISVNWTWPFASIGVDESAIGMRVFKRAHIIPAANVRRTYDAEDLEIPSFLRRTK